MAPTYSTDETADMLSKMERDIITLAWKVRMRDEAIANHLVRNGDDYFPGLKYDDVLPLVKEVVRRENDRIRRENAAFFQERAAAFAEIRAWMESCPSYRPFLDAVGRAGYRLR